MNYVIDCLTRKYSQFSGRARRREYWLFVLTIFIAGIIANRIDYTYRPLGWIDLTNAPRGELEISVGPLYLALFFLTLIPSIAVTVRRLRDTERSGRWVLSVLLPAVTLLFLTVVYFDILKSTPPGNVGLVAGVAFVASVFALTIGMIVLFVFMCLRGTDGANKYGPDPLEIKRPRLPEEI